MKKILHGNLFFILLIVIASFFVSQKLIGEKLTDINTSFYTSHDGEGHLIRMEEFDQAIKDGQFPVRLAKRINRGLGYPFFNFNYPLIYYTGEVIHLMGISFLLSFKILLVVSVLLGGISMYFLTLLYFDKWSSFISAVFFTIAPYKLLNMYVRGNIAESMGLALIPLLFLSIEYVLRQKKYSIPFFIFTVSILILSHNISAGLGAIFGTIYLLFQVKHYKNKRAIFFRFITGSLVSLLLTAFFWIPVLFENGIVRIKELSFDYPHFFPTLQEVLYSPWGFGGYIQGYSPGKMSPQIGILHEAFFVIAVLFIGIKIIRHTVKKKSEKEHAMNFTVYFIIIGIISLFLSLPYSQFLWDYIYPLRYVQLPFRFIGYVTLACSIAAGYVFFLIPRKYKIFLVIVCCGILLFVNRNHIRINLYYPYVSPLRENAPYHLSTTSKVEHMPIWSPLIYADPNQNGDVMNPGAGTSKRQIWKSNYHRFNVSLKSPSAFRDNTAYYPGWIATVNGKKQEIEYTKDLQGRLLLELSEGKHTVEFFFTETWYRSLANYISLFTVLGFILYNIMHQQIWIKKRSLRK